MALLYIFLIIVAHSLQLKRMENGWVKRHLHLMIWKLDRLIRSIWCCLETASIPLARSIWLERMTDS